MYRLKGYCKIGVLELKLAMMRYLPKEFYVLSKYNQRVNIAIGSFFL
jgi:hypothetical protein